MEKIVRLRLRYRKFPENSYLHELPYLSNCPFFVTNNRGHRHGRPFSPLPTTVHAPWFCIAGEALAFFYPRVDSLACGDIALPFDQKYCSQKLYTWCAYGIDTIPVHPHREEIHEEHQEEEEGAIIRCEYGCLFNKNVMQNLKKNGFLSGRKQRKTWSSCGWLCPFGPGCDRPESIEQLSPVGRCVLRF